jgi:hypothetical protein
MRNIATGGRAQRSAMWPAASCQCCGKVSVCREVVWLLPRTRDRWRKECSQWTSARRHDCSALSSGLQEASKWVIVCSLASMNRWACTGHDWREHSWPWQTGQVPWANLSEKAIQAYPKPESLSLHLPLSTGTHLLGVRFAPRNKSKSNLCAVLAK